MLRPQLIAALAADQLGGDTDPLAGGDVEVVLAEQEQVGPRQQPRAGRLRDLLGNLARARQVLRAAGDGSGDEVVAYSAVTRRGRENVWRAIEEALAASPQSPS